MKKQFLSLLFSVVLSIYLFVLPMNAGNSNKVALNITLPQFDSLKTNVNDYQWPIDVAARLTSSFGEYRTMHFHGGIDISTNGEVGHNIFSVRDGYVYRVSIEPYSYGKMLYIKHNDGYYSVYAHLLRFSDKIEEAVRAEQLRKGSFPINLIFDTPEIPVQKGEVVAYSGESGVGPPHLHFEIRDENLNNVNPILIYGDSLHDVISPTIRGVAVFPLDENSTIDGKTSSKFMSRFQRGKGTLNIPQLIKIHGQIGFGISALDRNSETPNKNGIHSLEFYLDDSLAYSMTMDRFPALETKQIYYHYDYPTLLHGKGEYQRLFVEEGNYLPFYHERKIGEGIINSDDLSEGEHPFKIVCADFKGNTTTLEGRLSPNRTPKVKIIKVESDHVLVATTGAESVSSIIVGGKKNATGAWTDNTIKKTNLEISGDTISVPVKTSGYDALKVIAASKEGAQSVPQLYFINKPSGVKEEFQADLTQTIDRITIKISSKGAITSEPVVTLRYESAETGIPVSRTGLNEFTGVINAGDVTTGVYMLEISGEVNSQQSSVTKALELYSIPTGGSGSFSLGNSGLVVSYDSGAVYKPMFLHWEEESNGTNPKFLLESKEVILNKGLRISYPIPQGGVESKYALYFRANGGWIYQTKKPDQSGMYYTTTISRTLGELTLFRDEQPPSIGKLRVAQRKGVISGNFSYGDNLSGINFDEIKVLVDDIVVIPEIDGEKRRVSFSTPALLSPGKHTLTVTIKDNMENEVKVTRVVNVAKYNISAQ